MSKSICGLTFSLAYPHRPAIQQIAVQYLKDTERNLDEDCGAIRRLSDSRLIAIRYQYRQLHDILKMSSEGETKKPESCSSQAFNTAWK